MKYLTFSTGDDPAPRLGVLHEGRVVAAEDLFGARNAEPLSLLGVIQAGPSLWRAASASLANGFQGRFAFDDVRCHAPIPRPPKNVVCLGLNYVTHIRETTSPDRAVKVPDVPIFFTKAATSVSGPFDPIVWDPSVTGQVDYEAELAVIIGRPGKNIPRERALDYVFGYTIVNDVSARDLQFGHKQWFKGKSLDTFCPMGPVVVTADEFGDPQRKRIALTVNGQTRQDATTADMLFHIDVIIEHLSRGMTLEPGDIIATGTPDGVGLGRTPPEYLRDGDVVETTIEGIGTLRNTVRKP